MSGRLDWEKAKSKEKARRRPSGKRKRGADRQLLLAAFADRHSLACFKCGCGFTTTTWAKSGWRKGQPWIICKECVQAKR